MAIRVSKKIDSLSLISTDSVLSSCFFNLLDIGEYGYASDLTHKPNRRDLTIFTIGMSVRS